MRAGNGGPVTLVCRAGALELSRGDRVWIEAGRFGRRFARLVNVIGITRGGRLRVQGQKLDGSGPTYIFEVRPGRVLGSQLAPAGRRGY